MEWEDSSETDHGKVTGNGMSENLTDKAMIDENGYETQYFGFAPSDLCEEVNEIMFEKFESSINKLEEKMKKVQSEILPEKELTDGISLLRTICFQNNEVILSKLKENLLKNIFKIPSNLLLPEDSDQASPSSSEEVEALKKEIEDINMQLKSERYIEAVLKEELKDIDTVLEAQNDLLQTTCSDSNVSYLEDEKGKLEVLSRNLKPLLNNYEMLKRRFESGLNEAKEDIEDDIHELCLK